MLITNQKPQPTLAQRINRLVEASKELKFLVGFFYFSAWPLLFEALKNNFDQREDLRLKVLVGLSASSLAGHLVELAEQLGGLSGQQLRQKMLEQLQQALSSRELDVPKLREHALFFLELLQSKRLEIRKSKEPCHAKLYLFCFNDHFSHTLNRKGHFITGSSNLTRLGLQEQLELNVEIGDWGFEEAEQFFDQLWRNAQPLRPEDFAEVERIIKRASLAALPSPLEIYALLLWRLQQLIQSHEHRIDPEPFLRKIGFQPFRYQIDAMNQIIHLLETVGGAILADVVGLGKTVVAALVVREVSSRGVVICPPALIGDPRTHGWAYYLERFDLPGWRVFSRGRLEEALDYVQRNPGIDMVIVDEAHHFRNPDTDGYALLKAICAGRKVLLLTATPLANSPQDLIALIELFDSPRQGRLGPLKDSSRMAYNLSERFRRLSYIERYHNHPDDRRRERALNYWQEEFPGWGDQIDLAMVRQAMERVASETRVLARAVVVRRNRLDLQRNPRYRDDAPSMPHVNNPSPIYFELTPEQSAFYDRVIEAFSPEGGFRAAIYRAMSYYAAAPDPEAIDDALLRFLLESERNLADFMRRLMVRRFESSFGAFLQTLRRLIETHERVLAVIEERGVFLQNRRALERLDQLLSEDAEEAEIDAFLAEQDDDVVLRIAAFTRREQFVEDIRADLALLRKIEEDALQLGLREETNDPKVRKLVAFLEAHLRDHPRQKVVVFSEFQDTLDHLEAAIEALNPQHVRALRVPRNPNESDIRRVVQNFDAALPPEKQHNDYNVLLASDKLSEGINLNRAALVINYDIPWNPTRLIQRLGRINRIGQVPHEEIFIYHFFPTEQGRPHAQMADVAAQKLLLIHRALGEDARILRPDEEPHPALLMQRLQDLPDEGEGVSLETWVLQEWEALQEAHPDIVQRVRELPNRVKTRILDAPESRDWLFVERSGGLFALDISEEQPRMIPLEEALLELKNLTNNSYDVVSRDFWNKYRKAEQLLERVEHLAFTPNSLESRAHNNVQTALRLHQLTEEEKQRLKLIVEDLQHYRRLPRAALRLLIRADLGDPANLGAFRQNLAHFWERYGAVLRPIEETPTPQIVVGVEMTCAGLTTAEF